MSRALCIMLVLLLVPIVGQAQEEKIKVSLEISADETIKPQVLSCMRNALRNIRDIEIVDKSYNYQLQIVFLKSSYGLYALSLFVLWKPDLSEQLQMFMTGILYDIEELRPNYNFFVIKDKIRKVIEETPINKALEFLFVVDALNSHVLIVHYSLQDMCKEVAARFDNGISERRRIYIKTDNAYQKVIRDQYNTYQKVIWAQTEMNKAGFYDGPKDGIMVGRLNRPIFLDRFLGLQNFL